MKMQLFKPNTSQETCMINSEIDIFSKKVKSGRGKLRACFIQVTNFAPNAFTILDQTVNMGTHFLCAPVH